MHDLCVQCGYIRILHVPSFPSACPAFAMRPRDYSRRAPKKAA